MKIPYYVMFGAIIIIALASFSFGNTTEGLGGIFCKIRNFFAGIALIMCVFAIVVMAILGIWI